MYKYKNHSFLEINEDLKIVFLTYSKKQSHKYRFAIERKVLKKSLLAK